MPLLFSIAIHDALVEVRLQQEGELLFAYMDDVYVVSKPDRTRVSLRSVGPQIAHNGRWPSWAHPVGKH